MRNPGGETGVLSGLSTRQKIRIRQSGFRRSLFSRIPEHTTGKIVSHDEDHDKLLLLKDGMNTKTGREMAEERHAYIADFLEEYRKETAVSS